MRADARLPASRFDAFVPDSRSSIASHDEPGSFADLLKPHERRLAGRLEGFGDIVFGFAISQCALMLTNAGGRVDITHPLALAFYFATFAILVSLWLTYHQIMATAFKPTSVDLVLSFTYLAFVSLMPYAMYAETHHVSTLESARTAVAEYTGLYALLMAIAAAVTLRNLRRGWYAADDEDRRRTWTGLVRRCTIAITMTVAVAIDLTAGPAAAGFALVSLFVVIRVARLVFPNPPSARTLRIAAPRKTAVPDDLEQHAPQIA